MQYNDVTFVYIINLRKVMNLLTVTVAAVALETIKCHLDFPQLF